MTVSQARQVSSSGGRIDISTTGSPLEVASGSSVVLSVSNRFVVLQAGAAFVVNGGVGGGGSVVLTAATSLTVNADVGTTGNGDVTLNAGSSIDVLGRLAAVTGDISLTATAGDIRLGNGSAVVNQGGFTMSAGVGIEQSGSVSVGSVAYEAVGPITIGTAINASGNVQIDVGGNVNLVTVEAAALTVVAGADVVLGGAIQLTGLLSVSSSGSVSQNESVQAGGVDYDAVGNLSIASSIAASGSVSIDAIGTTSVTAIVQAGGSVDVGADKAGSLNLGASVMTTGGNVTFKRVVTLTSAITIESAGGDIEFAGAVNTAGNDLTLDAGPNGNLTVTGDLTGGGVLLVRDAAVQSYAGLTVDTFTILDVATIISLNGTVSVAGEAHINSSGSLTQNGSVTATKVTYVAVGSIAINGPIASQGEIRITTQMNLFINDSGSASDLRVGAGADLVLSAGSNIKLGADVILVGVDGAISLTADTVTGNNGGSITMHDRALIDAGKGTIRLSADGNITVGGLLTTNASGSAVVLVTTSGTVVDGGDHYLDIDAIGRVIVNAAISPNPSNALGVKQTIQAIRNVVAAIQDRIRLSQAVAVISVRVETVIKISLDPLAPVKRPITEVIASITIDPLGINQPEAAVPFSPKRIVRLARPSLGSFQRSSTGGSLLTGIETQRGAVIPSGRLFELRGISGIAHLELLVDAADQ